MLLRRVMCVLVLCCCGLAAAAQAPGSKANDNTATPSAPPTVPGVSTPTTVPAGAAATEATTSPVAANSTGAQNPQTGGTKVHGFVTDPDGAAIPGATVSLQGKQGNAIRAKSGGDGSYTVTVSPGSYSLLVTMKGFASYSVTNLKVPAVAGISVDAKLAIGETEQVINVEASAMQISVDQDSNASSTVLTGKDLDALSDDPDELQSELTALAGPSAGPNGGQIYVDGFTGGQLPPKSSIREIRINQNPFSAQYDRLGYGRVEIFTKPGTDEFHGSLQVNGNSSSFNAGHAPNADPNLYVPPYHTLFIFGSISGPLTKWASFNVGGSHRDIEDDAYTNGTIYGHAGSLIPCNPGDATCANVPVQVFTHQPQSRTDISPRFDLALGKNNVLSTRFQVNRNEMVNQGIGSFALPSVGVYNSNSSFELQMSDTQTYGLHVINETRFEWERERARVTPNANGVYVSVSSAFTAGGSTAQGSDDHQDHFEEQNYTSIQTRKNFIRLGGRLRTNREAINDQGYTNGAFTYASLAAYQAGTATQFKRVVVNNTKVLYTLNDLGLYAETDWKPLSNLTVSYGLRYEVQDHFEEKHDFAPRASFAWGVGKDKNKPTTVVRGGIGMFYDRFGASSVKTLLENNGQNEYVTTFTKNTLPASCTPQNLSGCPSATGGTLVYTKPDQAHHLTSPYILQTAIGGDQQLGKMATISVNYLYAQGVHELAVQDVYCAPNSLGVCTNQSTFNDQYLSAGQFHEHQLMFNPKVQLSKAISLFGYYSYIFNTKGNNSGASTFLSTPGNINADYGRPTFAVTHRYFLAGSISLPAHIQVSPFVIGQSGNPVNITEGQDLNGDAVLNDRPYLVPTGTPGAVTFAGCGSFLSRAPGSPAAPAGSGIVPTNYCTGPALFTMNVRATKTWGFGGSKDKNAVQGGRQRGQGGPGGPGGPGGGGHQHGGGGPGGMFGGGGSNTGQRYNFSLGAQILNITNRANLANPVGTITSPFFGQSTQLTGMPYNSNNAAFRASLTASFTF